MGRYVKVTVSAEGLFAVAQRSWSTIGIVGRAIGSNFTVDTAYLIKSPTEAKDLFDESSALYQSILLAFQNGATEIWAIPTAVTAETPEPFAGDGNTKEFTLSKIPTQPIDSVTINAVPQVEGTDFTVDYGNSKIIFNTAPPSGSPAGDIIVGYSTHSTVQFQSALTVLEDYDVQLVCGAMIFDSLLFDDLLNHTVAMEPTKPRMGIYMLKNGETTLTLASLLASKLSILIAHKSLKDVSAACIGRIASLRPWESLTLKDVGGLEQTSKFTNTEIAAFDGAFIVTMLDPPLLTGIAVVFSNGWNLDPTRTLGFIDQVRVVHYLPSILELGLTNPNVIGKMRMNRAGLRQLNSFIASLLNPQVSAGAIDNYTIINPALNLFEKQNPDAADLDAIENLQATRSLSGAYQIQVQVVYAGAIEFISMELELTGGVA
jgi:hypothetical protein